MKALVILASLLSFFPGYASAEHYDTERIESSLSRDFIEYLDLGLNEVQRLNSPRAENECGGEFNPFGLPPNMPLLFGPPRFKHYGKVDSACLATYLRFYKKDTLDFRVAIGYGDEEDPDYPVYDKVEYDAFVAKITAPCRANVFACGFKQDPRDDTKFINTVIDPMGKAHRVVLTVVYSSVSSSNDTNLRLESQKAKTELAEKVFFEGAKTADAIFYSGHARNGGGPDFGPAVRTKSGHKNYKGYYEVQRPGLKRLVAALKQRKDGGIPFLSLAACSSEKHFAKEIRKVSPKSGMIVTTDLSYGIDGSAATLNAIDSLLGQRCQADFETAVERPNTNYSDTFRLKGFFRAP